MPVHPRRLIGSLATLALLGGAAATAAPAVAAPDGSAVVISEVYGGGGSGGATFNQDFVELYNPTSAPISLAGHSVQYRSATNTTGSFGGVVTLTGTIPAKGHWLVGLGTGTSGAPLPQTPDTTGGTALSATAGTVVLARQTTALTGVPAGPVSANAAIVDLVGYGANTFETAAAPNASISTSVARSATGADTDSNLADFAAGAPTPTSSAGGGTDPEPEPEPEPTDVTIARIQGTGDATPLAGQRVRTRGVVTAAYPTGGFRGLFIQTAGTGGAIDPATHDGSDALFVFMGSAPASSYPAIGSHVEVTGTADEFFGMTQVAATGVAPVAEPGSVAPAQVGWPRTAEEREDLEGMLLAPQGAFTVADNFSLNQFGEIRLAAGTTTLPQATDVARPLSPEALAVEADNLAREVVLDDGATANFLTTAKDTPLPWLTGHPSIRVGAPATFTGPVVLDYRFDQWRFQPTQQLSAANDATVRPATFADTRRSAPEPVAGDVTVASFNVLNFFKETGVDYVADGGVCSSFADRAGNPITVRSCTGEGPRGAWDATNRDRQQAKTVEAINGLDADVLGLMEIENSAKFVTPERRDDALAFLVDALNADAGFAKWDYVRSPAVADQPALADQDVIRNAFIYQPAVVETVGASQMHVDPAFDNAREPEAQVFRPVGGEVEQEFVAIVNHFKSKGSGSGEDADQGDGQGASNASRVRQAESLVGFVDEVTASAGTDRVFLLGDFNAYTQEDPMQVLYDAGFEDLTSQKAEESTYVFSGRTGSLDHVLASESILDDVRDADVWQINSVESVAYEYSRFNYNATSFYAADPFRASDHDPLLVGFDNPLVALPTELDAEVEPDRPKGDRPATVIVEVTTERGDVDGGTVEVREGGRLLGTAPVVDGVARVEVVIQRDGPAHRTLVIDFSGADGAEAASTTLRVKVDKSKGKGHDDDKGPGKGKGPKPPHRR